MERNAIMASDDSDKIFSILSYDPARISRLPFMIKFEALLCNNSSLRLFDMTAFQMCAFSPNSYNQAAEPSRAIPLNLGFKRLLKNQSGNQCHSNSLKSQNLTIY
jgi:hypothetical protein